VGVDDADKCRVDPLLLFLFGFGFKKMFYLNGQKLTSLFSVP